MTTTIEMSECTCWECGIVFTVPYMYLKAKMREDDDDDDYKPVYCPNGHTFRCTFKNEPEAEKLQKQLDEANEEVDDLRRQLVQEIHNADQAAARANEGKPPVEPVLEPDPVEAAGDSDAGTGEAKCPKCGKVYDLSQGNGWFARHLKKSHGVKDEEAQAMINAALQAASK